MDDASLLRTHASRLKRYPLETARLWHRDAPRTSQRAICAIAANPLIDAVLVSGGNGTGKTHLNVMLAVATAAGRHAPWVQAWAKANGFPLERFPDRMGRALVSGLTSNDLRRYLKPKVEEYLPEGCRWINEGGNGESEVILPGGDKKLGRIVFKSNDQGARAYQGDWFDYAGLDEEHDRDVFNECLMRVARVPGGMGWVVCTMTPLKGRTWVYDEFVRQQKPGNAAFWLYAEDNPYLPAEKMERALARYGTHEQAARRHGDFTVLDGMVYPQFSRHLHVIPHFDPPAHWPRFRSWDFGTRNPTHVGWYALDTKDDVLHKYREHHQAEWTLRQHAEHVKAQEAADFYWTVADSADAGSRLTLAVEHGIETIPSHKDVRAHLNRVSERLNPDAEGRPHYLIHDNCPNTIREYEGYVWAKRGGANDQPDMPVKANDHGIDTDAYQMTALARSEFARTAPVEDEQGEEAA